MTLRLPGRGPAFLSAILLILFAAEPVSAQTYTWNNYTGAGDTLWGTAANWVTPPIFGTDTTLILLSSDSLQTAPAYTTTVNSFKDVNALTFASFASDLTPIQVAFNTASSQIRFNISSGNVQPRISMLGTGAVTIQNGPADTDIVLVGGAQLQLLGGGPGALTIAGVIGESGGVGSLYIDRGTAGPAGLSGSTTLSASNTFTGGVTLASGNLVIGSNAAQVLGTGTFTVAGADNTFRFGVSGVTFSNAVVLNQTLRIAGDSSTGDTFAGAISGSGGLTFIQGNGNTQYIFTAANTFTGAVTVAPIAVSFARVWLQGNGTMLNASEYTVTGSGADFFTLNNAVTNLSRVNPNAALTLNSGQFQFIGNASAATSETFAQLNTSGGAILTLQPAAGGELRTTFTNGWVRAPGSTAIFTGNNLGKAPAAGVPNVVFGVDPGGSVGGGGAAGTTTLSVLPYAFSEVYSPTLLLGYGLVRWDSGTGRIIPLDLNTEYASNLFTTGTRAPSGNFKAFASTTDGAIGGVAGLNSPTSMNALVLNGYSQSTGNHVRVGLSVGGSGTMTLNGGVLVVGAAGPSFAYTSSQINVAGLTAGAIPLYVNHGASASINCVISGSGGLIESGAGTISLTGNNTFTGGVTVNTGINIDRDANLGDPSNGINLNGGQLAFIPQTLYGPGPASNMLTLSRPFTLGPSGGIFALGGPNLTLALAGTVGGTGGVQLGAFGNLFLTGTNSFAGDVVINGGVIGAQTDAALGAPTNRVALKGATFQPLSSYSTNRDFLMFDFGSGRPNVIFTNGNDLTINGIVGGAGVVGSSPFTKTGGGTLTLTAANPFTGDVLVGDPRISFGNFQPAVTSSAPQGAQTAGTLKLSGPNGALAVASAVYVDPGARLWLDNSGSAANANNNRLGTVPIQVAGELRLTGNANVDVTEGLGTLTAGILGSSATFNVPLSATVTLDQPTGGNHTTALVLQNYTPVSSSFTFFRGTNLGATSGDRTRVLFNTAQTLTAGILPSAVGAADPNAAFPTDFVTTVAAGSQQELRIFTNYVSGLPATGGSSTTVYDQTGSTVTLTANVAAGALRLGNGGGVVMAAHNITLSSGALLALPGNTGVTGGTINFGSTPARITASGDVSVTHISGNGGLTKFGPGVLTVQGTYGITDSTGAFVLNVAQGTFRGTAVAGVRVNLGAGATMDLNNGAGDIERLTGYGTVNIGVGALILRGGGNFFPTFGGSFAGSGPIFKTTDAAGVQIVNGDSPNYTGQVSILSGELWVHSHGALGTGSGAVLLGALSGTNFAHLLLGPAVQSFSRDITVQSGSTPGIPLRLTTQGALVTLTGQITLNQNLDVVSAQNGVLNLNGKITGTGRLQLQTNIGSVNLNNPLNDYSGGTLLSLNPNQVLGLASNNALGTGPVTVGATQGNGAGYIRADNGARTIANPFTLNGQLDFGVTGRNDLTLSSTFTYGSGATANHLNILNMGLTTFAGNVAGSAPLAKNGPGTLVFSNPAGNSYTGATTVNAGTLVVNNTSGSGTGTAALTVNTGAILSGSGRVGSATTVTAGGIVRPGATDAGTETLTFTGSGANAVVMAAGSTLQINVKEGANGKMVLNSGTLNLSGLTTANPLTIFLTDVGLQFGPHTATVIDTGANSINFGGGGFDPSKFALATNFDASLLSVTNPTAATILVAFTVTPEPGQLLLAAAAGVGLVGGLRRIRNRAWAGLAV